MKYERKDNSLEFVVFCLFAIPIAASNIALVVIIVTVMLLNIVSNCFCNSRFDDFLLQYSSIYCIQLSKTSSECEQSFAWWLAIHFKSNGALCSAAVTAGMTSATARVFATTTPALCKFIATTKIEEKS